ncbi:CTH1 [Symbiodinium microadriaticum]|nr:CTH1 [Symbiodinium microadriaticum]CAE7892476.1 CTH1 [Symbiodinium sp. KB8]
MAAEKTQIMCDDSEARRLQVHKKTQLCKFFAVGACTRGSSCAFAHGSAQLREQPDFSKTRLCADFMELGRCERGRSCKFAHGRQELRPGSAAKVGRPGLKAPKLGKPEAGEPSAVVQALETLRKRQLHHECAAMNLMLQCALAGPPPAQGKSSKSELPEISFSRQTTWEGMETASTGFSRASSDASTASIPEPEQPEMPRAEAQVTGWEVRVKNTFIEVQVDDEWVVPVMRRTKSLPSFTAL